MAATFFVFLYVVWLRIILETMHTPQKDYNIEIFTENKSAISLGKIKIHFFFMREAIISTPNITLL